MSAIDARFARAPSGESRAARRTVAIACLLWLVVMSSLGPTTAAAASVGYWHRNNYGTEHERLTCREAVASWTCFYDKVPEEGFSWDDRTGRFTGRNVTESWSCPTWFDSTVCDNVVAVYRGIETFTGGGQHPITAVQEYVVTEVNGQAILYVYWVDSFYCPWFRTFDEALAADYNCTFAP
jgi:hypothetical protein